jgi:hypothetical protein
MKRLLTSAISCGTFLIASCVSLPANAATSATIKASGTIPDTCSVLGNETIQLLKRPNGTLAGNGPITLKTSSVNTGFALSTPIATYPSGVDSTDYPVVAGIYDIADGTLLAVADPINSTYTAYTPTQAIDKQYDAIISITNPNDIPYPPGLYEVTTTLTCIN